MIRFTLVIFLFLTFLPCGYAKAKTNPPADPGSGTGGITITGFSNIMGGDDVQGGGKAYDEGIRKVAKMPPEWFTCKTTDDCGLVPVPCGTSFSVNKTHKGEAEAACATAQICGPNVSCAASRPDTSLAVCKNGQCVTVIQPYKQ